ncbi:hypothetical protein niasHT_035961 [Heterodera trifolii]|uniref:Uncharacterized protein n=1 Tax=Heterodera trifolii TaxID=157864 RepID=A0ABD2J8A7_9BILA
MALKHTVRMLLIPEDVYRRLMANPGGMATTSTTAGMNKLPTPATPIEHTARKMVAASSKLTNDDERLIHYQQEFKRYQKLLEEEAERPLNVQLSQRTTDALRDTVLQKAMPATATTPPTTRPQRTTPLSRRRQGLQQHKQAPSASSFSSSRPTKSSSSNSSSDEQPQQPLPQQTAAQQKIGDLPKQAEPRMQAAMAYAQQNPGLLGVGGEDGQQILHLAQGAYRPIKGSNLGTLLRYHFVGRHQQQQPRSSSTTTPRTSVAKAPPGYKTFVNNAHDDLQMWRLLFPDERAAAAGSDSASTVGGQPRRHQPLRGQKKTGAGRFSLSLLQPKQHAYKSVQKSATSKRKTNTAEHSTAKREAPAPRRPSYARGGHRYLAGQRVYTLHRQVRRRFRRLPTLASGLHTDWQADLADFQRLRAQNRGYAYLLVCIDTLSRQVYVQPVKSKRSDDMITALKRTFARCGYTPWRLLTDKGREFTASAVQRYLRDEAEVRHHCMETSPLWHAGMAERANRSIKERLYRYFTHRGTQCWTRVIQRIVSSLNESPNSSIFGMRPNEVCFENAESLRQRIADRAEAERSGRASQHPRFRPGDQVRIERARGAFRKGYLPRFTDEVFTVDRVCTGRRPITYKLRDRDGEPITGLFYANDMCLVLLPPSLDDSSSSSDQRKTRKRLPEDSDKNKVYAIERILERRYRKDGTECCLVKWKGYSTRHNSWIPAHTII